MAKYLEYKLHAPMNGHGKSTPTFITNGGHWFYNDRIVSTDATNTDKFQFIHIFYT